MTESEAREECRKRGRDPDREMTGPQGKFKAWELYRAIDKTASGCSRL